MNKQNTLIIYDSSTHNSQTELFVDNLCDIFDLYNLKFDMLGVYNVPSAIQDNINLDLNKYDTFIIVSPKYRISNGYFSSLIIEKFIRKYSKFMEHRIIRLIFTNEGISTQISSNDIFSTLTKHNLKLDSTPITIDNVSFDKNNNLSGEGLDLLNLIISNVGSNLEPQKHETFIYNS